MCEKYKKDSPNGQISEGNVEILADNGAHYKAWVVDIIEPKRAPDLSQLTLRFENDWHRMETFPISRIRLPPISGQTSSDEEFAEGTEVEVLAAGLEGEGFGFWKCVIKYIKGDFYVVSFAVDNNSAKQIDFQKHCFGEIVPKDRIRVLNTNPYLSSNPFFKFGLQVPQDLVKLDPLLIANNESHQHFKIALSLMTVHYIDAINQLVCIGFADKNKDYWLSITIKRAQVLGEIHFRSLRQKSELLSQTQALRQQLKNFGEVTKHKDNEFELLVRIKDHLIGLAIGANGSNLKRIMKVPGVLAITRNEGVFRIISRSRESCLIAKGMLEYMESVIEVPRDIVAHVIGKRGKYIQELTDRSGLSSVVIKGEERDKPLKPYIPFIFVGTREPIENATIIMNFQLNCIKENIEIDKRSPKMVNKTKH